ncbi:MAG: hypothetical protein ACI9FN_003150 [Saprospiraceae bacterium]|jgi:hypothetical protein
MVKEVFGDFLEKWEHIVAYPNSSALKGLLADDVVFYSPVVHTPQEGKSLTSMYLTGATQALTNEFVYKKKIIDGLNGVLEFARMIDDIQVEGVDIIALNEEGKVKSFKVMIRPLKAVHKIHEKMGELLTQMSTTK